MTIKAVIFDLDNTLVNRRTAFQIFSNRFIDKYVECKDYGSRSEIINLMRIADRDGYRNKRELFDELKTSLVMNNNEIKTDELLNFWSSEFLDCTVLMNGALEVLDYLKSKNYKLGIITNGSVYSQNTKIDKVKIREYFDTILVSDEMGIKKPDKEIFDIALDRLGFRAESCLFVGDNPELDVIGARAAGLNAVWLEGFMEWKEASEVPINKINQLLDLIHVVEDNSRKARNF